MKRKVIQIADSTQLVSLPRKWALQHGIKKGDEIDVREEGNRIIISTEKEKDVGRIDIDVTDLDRTSILYYLEILYRLGYDEINIHFSEPYAVHFRTAKKEKISSILHYVVGRLIGVEIINQSEKSCIIKSLHELSNKEFETALRRSFLLLTDMSKDLYEGVKNNNRELLESIEEKHDSFTKFVSYCLRILNKVGYFEQRRPIIMYHILASLDKLVDIIKYSARDILEYKQELHADTISVLEKINQNIRWYQELFYKFEIKRIKELYENRDKVIRIIKRSSGKIPPKEGLLLQYLEHSLEFLVDLTQSRIGLEN